MLLAHLFERIISVGSLRIIDGGGRSFAFEGSPGASVAIRFHDPALHWKLLVRPRLFMPEAYVDGSLTIEEGNLYDFIDLMTANLELLPEGFLGRYLNGAFSPLRRLHQYNPLPRARRNVAHHYDLSEELYASFLDQDRQYSCAYFRDGTDDLDTAQLHKKRHIAAKLLIRPGQRVLDIGSGWGGLALYLAGECGARVTGLTLSSEQHKVAVRRAATAGLADRVEFHLRDYREESGHYDRIVSIGMFEHVGVNHYATYFRKVRDLLADDGVALIHTIGRSAPPSTTSGFIAKYIFPGGYIPALSEMAAAIEHSGLVISDIEILRLHYAKTLRAWRQRFMANWDKAAAIRDERFCRMWEFYLAGCEISFRYMNQMVFQLQLARKPTAAPLTRDYMLDAEKGITVRRSMAAE
jgi:cyclopropane-fatty-acyl-phospholipid synthase